MNYGRRTAPIRASDGNSGLRVTHRLPIPCFPGTLKYTVRGNASGLSVEIGDGEPASQKAEVKGNGSAVNISAFSHKPQILSLAKRIWFGLEVLSVAILIYMACTSRAHGF